MISLRSKAKSILAEKMPSLFGLLRSSEVIWNSIFPRLHELEFENLPKLSEGAFIVDVGANLGQSAVCFVYLFKRPNILCFEPNKKCHKTLKIVRFFLWFRRAKVKLVSKGVGLKNGKATFQVPVNQSGVHFLQEGFVSETSVVPSLISSRIGSKFKLVEEAIGIVSLDGFVNHADLIKIDTQGFELQVLQGAEKLIRNSRPYIFLEICDRRETATACFELLSSWDYQIQSYETNALFVPKELSR